jgi:hypothetical protein
MQEGGYSVLQVLQPVDENLLFHDEVEVHSPEMKIFRIKI